MSSTAGDGEDSASNFDMIENVLRSSEFVESHDPLNRWQIDGC